MPSIARVVFSFISTFLRSKDAKTFVETLLSSLTNAITAEESSMTAALISVRLNLISLVATTQSPSRVSQQIHLFVRSQSQHQSVLSPERALQEHHDFHLPNRSLPVRPARHDPQNLHSRRTQKGLPLVRQDSNHQTNITRTLSDSRHHRRVSDSRLGQLSSQRYFLV